MTESRDTIKVKGYATFDPLKTCLVGRTYSREQFKDIKNQKCGLTDGPTEGQTDRLTDQHLNIKSSDEVKNILFRIK